jgi:hypothetical protein
VAVEAAQITRDSPRRAHVDVMTPPKGAMEIVNTRNALSSVVDRFGERAYNHAKLDTATRERLRQRVRQRCKDLLDSWIGVVQAG